MTGRSEGEPDALLPVASSGWFDGLLFMLSTPGHLHCLPDAVKCQ